MATISTQPVNRRKSVDALLSSTDTEQAKPPCSPAEARMPLMRDRDDSQLMRAYADGDATAFEPLYTRHKQALFRYVRHSCSNEAVAHELFQDIWLHLIKGRTTYHEASPFKAWLYRIARNRLIDHYRQQPAIADSPLDHDLPVSHMSNLVTTPLTPLEIADLSERANVLHAAVQDLPAAQREAVLLRHIAGMSLQEIADHLGEGAETIKSRLRYATAKLRLHLQELSH